VLKFSVQTLFFRGVLKFAAHTLVLPGNGARQVPNVLHSISQLESIKSIVKGREHDELVGELQARAAAAAGTFGPQVTPRQRARNIHF
jgi:hypothetical protein